MTSVSTAPILSSSNSTTTTAVVVGGGSSSNQGSMSESVEAATTTSTSGSSRSVLLVPPSVAAGSHPRVTTTAVAVDDGTMVSNIHPNNNNNKMTHTNSSAAAGGGTEAAVHSHNQQQPQQQQQPHNGMEQKISYSAERVIGNGSFGVVFEARVVETDEIVAIKKVLQDKRFKNRELQIMRQLSKDPHSNIVALRHCFYSQGEKQDELYLNLVLEFIPETVYSISRWHQKQKMQLPILLVKLYLYQLSRALAHIHSMGICHRDIKPQNLLVNPKTQQLKLCDFGSAKALIPGEPNVSYICSRYYRAPELIFGSTDYTTAIDIWSEGCVGAELLLGQPLFPGDSGVDQLVEIIKVLGTPTKEEINSMNSNYIEFKFPQIKGCQWRKIFRNKTPDEAMDFIASTLAYTPSKRLKPLAGCAHVFFDELRLETTQLPNNTGPLPPLFDFTDREMVSEPNLMDMLLPAHLKSQQSSKPRAKTTDTKG